jgi:hypothetical protein
MTRPKLRATRPSPHACQEDVPVYCQRCLVRGHHRVAQHQGRIRIKQEAVTGHDNELTIDLCTLCYHTLGRDDLLELIEVVPS